MAKDLLQLAVNLEAKSKAIEKAASKVAADIALEIVKDLAYKTPVDTSQALSNWIIGLGSPVTSAIDPYFPGYLGSTRKLSASETINQAKRILGGKKPGVLINITNNVDYITKLNEEGSSAQQPAGFVERSVLIGRKMLKNFRIKV